jgi:ribosomal protein S18 acetylase RimI-like enzyme
MSARDRDGVDVTIRPVRADDARALHATCWPERGYAAVQIRVQTAIDLAERERGWGRVAEIDGEIVGYGQLGRWHRPQLGEISNLAVGEGWRGRGVGAALIEALLALAREQEIHRVEIAAARSNGRAMALYERLGFTPDREVILDLGDGAERVVYLSIEV